MNSYLQEAKMAQTDLAHMSVKDWEKVLLDRGNTMEIQYHGGGNYISQMLWVTMNLPNRFEVYSKVVQATLNHWDELAAVERDDWEICPIYAVSVAAFDREHVLLNDLREPYERLWRESPRPHSRIHKTIALNSGDALPVTRAELGLLSYLDEQWLLIAARIAGKKEWTNDGILLVEEIFENKSNIDPWFLEEMVQMGFPKLKALRWLRQLHNNQESAQIFISKWEEELLAEDVSEE